MIVRLHPAASRELRDAAVWYAVNAGKPVAADLARAYAEAIELLREHPLLGAPAPFETRALSLRRFPFSIVYRINEGGLLVIAIAHHRRRPQYWSGRRTVPK